MNSLAVLPFPHKTGARCKYGEATVYLVYTIVACVRLFCVAVFGETEHKAKHDQMHNFTASVTAGIVHELLADACRLVYFLIQDMS